MYVGNRDGSFGHRRDNNYFTQLRSRLAFLSTNSSLSASGAEFSQAPTSRITCYMIVTSWVMQFEPRRRERNGAPISSGHTNSAYRIPRFRQFKKSEYFARFFTLLVLLITVACIMEVLHANLKPSALRFLREFYKPFR